MNTLRKLSNLVVLPHSVFALPFALSALEIAYVKNQAEGKYTPITPLLLLVLVVVAIIAARTAAMVFNRLVDCQIDRRNPRTASRPLASGVVTGRFAWLSFVISSLVFFASSYFLGWHCFVLSPLVFFVLVGYSMAKRFTEYSHLVLGLALALAPGGAWWVLRPEVEAVPLFLMAAVIFWVAGFDILYSCQDYSFDRAENLHSIPARFGIERAFTMARLSHLLAAVCFLTLGMFIGAGVIYYIGTGLVVALFLGQHLLVSPDDLSRINHAFFTTNGCVSIVYFLTVTLHVWLGN
ncbi:MAG: putative 4-hydroxybenzoate polyprenyltransferase [bacterium]|nr:putative 4-hydroxybenzoate polyprenyltransferase [bacterium]